MSKAAGKLQPETPQEQKSVPVSWIAGLARQRYGRHVTAMAYSFIVILLAIVGYWGLGSLAPGLLSSSVASTPKPGATRESAEQAEITAARAALEREIAAEESEARKRLQSSSK